MSFKDLFMCVCVYVNAFASSVCVGVHRGRRHQILWNWREVVVSYLIRVLGSELRSSVRVVPLLITWLCLQSFVLFF